MNDGHTQDQIDAGFETVDLLVELARASGASGTSDDVVRGATARIRTLEAELARRHDYDAVVNALKTTTTAKAIKDKMVEQASAHLLAALSLHPPGQCTGEGCGCECLCVEELAGMAAKKLADANRLLGQRHEPPSKGTNHEEA